MIWHRTATILLVTLTVAAQAPTASIEGIVIAANESRSPVLGATVEVRRLDGSVPQSYSATTARDGTFRVSNIRPGQYLLTARRAGYFTGEYGQRRVSRPGVPFTLVSGQSIRGVELTLTPSGVIHGRLTNQEGRPAAAAEVHALTPSYSNGVRTLKLVQTTVTNDLGQYRLFDLAPGTYYISAIPSSGTIPILSLIANGGSESQLQTTPRPLPI